MKIFWVGRIARCNSAEVNKHVFYIRKQNSFHQQSTVIEQWKTALSRQDTSKVWKAFN